MGDSARYYDELFSEDMAFRQRWEGAIALKYRVPKEVGYLIDLLKDRNPSSLSILEVGAGDGLSSKMVVDALKPKRYVATELSAEGVKKIRALGIEAEQMDATSLKFDDASFDAVACFNVMHHVNDPRKMAREMLRVTREDFLLCESNALSIPRRLLELTPRNRRANERSYTPSAYRSFFAGDMLDWVRVTPFMFAFAFTPEPLIPASAWLSELFEKVPVFRWQGSSLLIWGKKAKL